MAYRTKFLVTYGNRCARFSSHRDAMEWAKYISGMAGFYVEVSNSKGDLVGQYDDGKLTPEFKGYDYEPEEDEPDASRIARGPDSGTGSILLHESFADSREDY